MSGPNREKEIFEAALDIAGKADRKGFVRKACGSDDALLARVQALLLAHETAAGFLPDPPVSTPRPTGASAGDEGPGTVIGRYKLLEQIGEGGFGVVYMAEQLEPVRRRVALKIIKPGMDSKQVIGRFEAERQALAMMEHPHIARVLDAGATETGRPYFVMELVHGIPITKFCEEQQLDLEARLELFINVCAAVQHAHQKGVIHRDLKPSNILVTLHGDQPVPKVIDFGIAKAIEQRLTEKTVFTQFQQFMGTPAYMSPEQAALSGLDVDTRSDIYSLGVLLYELLTGTPPFQTKELLSAGLDEMRRMIREQEPERPSTKIKRETGNTRALACPQPAPSPAGSEGDHPMEGRMREGAFDEGVKLKRGMRGRGRSPIPSDLDWIVMRALEKDRNRRYETANGLVADLKRCLSNEPVTARPPTLRYRFGRFSRRHRSLLTLGAAGAVLLLFGAVVSGWQALRARQAEKQALVEAATARGVSRFLWKGLMKQLSPWGYTNRQVTLHEAVDAAAGEIGDRLGGQPLAEASVRLVFGKAYTGLSELSRAETNLLRSVRLRRRHSGDAALPTAEALFALATLRHFQGRRAAAETLFDEVVEIRTRALGPQHPDTVLAAVQAGLEKAAQLEPAAAGRQLERLRAEARRYLGPNSDVSGTVGNRLGMIWLEQGAFDRAYQLFEETHRLAVRADGEESASALWSRELMAAARARQGRFAEAEAELRDITAIHERISGPDHGLTRDARLARIAEVLVPQQRFAEAATILLRVAQTEYPRLDQQLRPFTQHVMRRLETAWRARGGGPDYDLFRAAIQIYRPPPDDARTAPAKPSPE